MSEQKEIKYDYLNNEIESDESGDDKIMVWKITPHLHYEDRCCLIRCRDRATEYLVGVVDALAASANAADETCEALVMIETVEITLREYKNLPKTGEGD